MPMFKFTSEAGSLLLIVVLMTLPRALQRWRVPTIPQNTGPVAMPMSQVQQRSCRSAWEYCSANLTARMGSSA